ncbi:MAG: hypothetical protein J6S14_12440 [Clostridia bacterium]|nr:hypothetical protein [Clostridia bacterium]
MLTINRTVTASPDQWSIIIEGMRNPMESWDKSDTYWSDDFEDSEKDWVGYDSGSGSVMVIGDNDLNLMLKLSRAGSDHAKFRRMIPVYLTITAPLYWWKEFDTYKVGTTTNSCSTMHKIHAHEFTFDDFSVDRLTPWSLNIFEDTINTLNLWRHEYLDTGDKTAWEQLIQLLPSSYNQRRTVCLNYEVLHNIYHARRNHKLTEWHTLCDHILKLPYSEIITGEATQPCTTSN